MRNLYYHNYSTAVGNLYYHNYSTAVGSYNLAGANNLPNGIKIYKNLHTIDTQLLIKNDNKHKAGIYCILNNINGKFYIGSAITNRISVRFRNHCIHSSGGNIYIKNAINKYGLNNFNFIILEYYPGLILKENLKKSH